MNRRDLTDILASIPLLRLLVKMPKAEGMLTLTSIRECERDSAWSTKPTKAILTTYPDFELMVCIPEVMIAYARDNKDRLHCFLSHDGENWSDAMI